MSPPNPIKNRTCEGPIFYWIWWRVHAEKNAFWTALPGLSQSAEYISTPVVGTARAPCQKAFFYPWVGFRARWGRVWGRPRWSADHHRGLLEITYSCLLPTAFSTLGGVPRHGAILNVGGSPILSERRTLSFKSGVSVIKWGLH